MTRLRWLSIALAASLYITGARAGEVSGRVEMPATCSPAVSPAVVSLERLDGRADMSVPDRAAQFTLVNQRGLQFEPRVQAVQVGQVIRFTNADNETHNVHIQGVPFNESMGKDRSVDYRTSKEGLLRIVCDVHSHMRAYVVVSPTPYYSVCLPDGRFRLDGVPDGRYRLHVWHEMGQGTTRQVDVRGDEPVILSGLAVEAAPIAAAGPAAPARSWSEVIDRIGVLLGEARATASQTRASTRLREGEVDALPDDQGAFEATRAGMNKARKLAEDA